MFQKATKKQSKLRMALMGPSGSGKTYTSLKIASELGQKIALIDTEYGSASKYADEFEFDALNLTEISIDNYINAINAASKMGYDVLIIDSISHAWDAILELVDKIAKRSKSGNTFAAWSEGTPEQQRFVKSILSSHCHVIATMRSKTEYVIENVNGRNVPKKIGLAPVQRQGVEYEFDIVAEMDTDNNFIITKTRCKELNQAVVKYAAGVAEKIKAWLDDGEEDAEKPVLTMSRSEALEKLLSIINDKHIPQERVQVALSRAQCDELQDLPVDKMQKLIDA